MRNRCQEQFEKTGNQPLYWECMQNVPECSQIIERGYQSYWGKGNRFRCQTYCKDQNCGCCDNGGREKRTTTRAALENSRQQFWQAVAQTVGFAWPSCRAATIRVPTAQELLAESFARTFSSK